MVATTTVIIIIGFLHLHGAVLDVRQEDRKGRRQGRRQERAASQRLYDGVDYVPAHKAVLFGHHFSSIAGAGPLVGPAMAMVWGWLRGFSGSWFGNVLIGSIHDYLALMASVRYDAKSVQFVATDLISSARGAPLLDRVLPAHPRRGGLRQRHRFHVCRTPPSGPASIFMTIAAIILGHSSTG